MTVEPLPVPSREDPTAPDAPAGRRRLGDGRGYLGLALLGWGLSILAGVIPHEDLLVGSGLALFGAALVATAPRLPQARHLAPAWIGGLGLALALGVVAYDAWAQATLDMPKVAIIAFGLALAGVAPWVRSHRSITLPGGAAVTPGTLVAASIPVLAAPLAMWAAQAAFSAAVGVTPTEAFVQVGLLAPVSLVLWLIGMNPSLHGQTVTYTTANGPLSLEVGAACSGVQAMALFAAVLALYLWAERPGGRRLLVWSCIGLAGIYVANLLRLVMLFLVGYQWGPEALVRAHAEAGWVFFVAWAIVFARLARAPRPAIDTHL